MRLLPLLQIKPGTPDPELLATFSNNRFCPNVLVEGKTGHLCVCQFSCGITMTTSSFLNPVLKHSRSFSMQRRFALDGWMARIIYTSLGNETDVSRR